ncbi:ATP-binding protein [Streptomyces sp. NBC_01304]|uniref:ATP-binding protein n=1 Tax=Streptomyces sp. NBC_01304 TaxID=2903818 RepID=UPI002E1175CE|nr:ATP-binding protein [Streptomyces sp. NBC_01304]
MSYRSSEFSLVFPPDPAWVRVAREAVRAAAHHSGIGELDDTAALLTSEVVTNAVIACQGGRCDAPVALHAQWAAPGSLHVLVRDAAPGFPVQRAAPPDEEGGRGLHLIGACATEWGVCRHGAGSGKAVWFQLGGGGAASGL